MKPSFPSYDIDVLAADSFYYGGVMAADLHHSCCLQIVPYCFIVWEVGCVMWRLLLLMVIILL